FGTGSAFAPTACRKKLYSSTFSNTNRSRPFFVMTTGSLNALSLYVAKLRINSVVVTCRFLQAPKIIPINTDGPADSRQAQAHARFPWCFGRRARQARYPHLMSHTNNKHNAGLP